jgi:hypothetical protein
MKSFLNGESPVDGLHEAPGNRPRLARGPRRLGTLGAALKAAEHLSDALALAREDWAGGRVGTVALAR